MAPGLFRAALLGAFLIGSATPAPAHGWAVEIAPGVFMPYVSLGHPDDNSSTAADVEMWLREGGVGLDTAWNYHNQPLVATGIERSKRARESIFVTTKIPCFEREEIALAFVLDDLRQLRTKYVDLMLLHSPCASHEGTAASWRALQLALGRGLARAIGVSNFAQADLAAAIDGSKALGGVLPAVNQCSMSIGHRDQPMLELCRRLGITYEAYSPLRHVQLSDARLLAVAKAHGKSAAQIALRWILQQGVPLATSPGASHEFTRQDLELDTFELTPAEMDALSAIGAG
ncbi:hypothetical protein KFE25_003969 [Diacronema lutheri]|uniref:NADP-dependent oxidoreductase domain-containing protein n=2 Tax=Diacronema lutheri TaxID=2081491 RepID=A0A8J5XDU7_DIALT|nr:hypothetical protein KFE25_003969 [Diacronema lutheri]